MSKLFFDLRRTRQNCLPGSEGRFDCVGGGCCGGAFGGGER